MLGLLHAPLGRLQTPGRSLQTPDLTNGGTRGKGGDCICPASIPDCLCPTTSHAAANDTWQPTWIFVSGFHHSGTTLVSRALANASEEQGTIVTHYQQNEGGHQQTLWPTASEVLLKGYCANWTAALCLPAFVELPSGEEQAAQLRKEWRPYVVPTDAPVVIEKDPEFTSVHYKLALFPRRSVAILVMRHPYTTYASYVRASLCADAAECLSLWSATWLFNLRQLEMMSRNYAVVRSEGLTSLERAHELIRLVQDHTAQLPGRERLVDEAEVKRLLDVSFTRNAPTSELGYHPQLRDSAGGEQGNDDPWRAFDVNQTLTYEWARTPEGKAKVEDPLSAESDAAAQEWAGYSLTDPEGGSADGLLVYSSFVDNKDMERPKFAKAAAKNTAASRLLRTTASKLQPQKESLPQGGSCAADCKTKAAKAAEASTGAQGAQQEQQQTTVSQQQQRGHAGSVYPLAGKECEVLCQLKQLPVLGLANSVLAAMGDVQVTGHAQLEQTSSS
jgi:hypothetical protein